MTDRDYLEMAAEIDRDHADEVTDWEAEFLESMMVKYKGYAHAHLTGRQKEIINRMWEKYCG